MSAARLLACVALLAVAGCSGASSSNVQASAVVASSYTPAPALGPTLGPTLEYRLSPGDLLSITVFQVPDLTREVQVDDAGGISLPLIGNMRAQGLTAHALETQITAKLKARYLQSPQVSVFLKKTAGNQVTVDGEVKNPGMVPITGRLSLVQAIARSGGIDDVGDSNAVLVLRDTGGKRLAAKFNVADIRAGKAADPDLYAGDTVIIDRSGSLSAWKNIKETLPAFAFFSPLL